MSKNPDVFTEEYNLVKRVFNMLHYFQFFYRHEKRLTNYELQMEIRERLQSLDGIEGIAKYFEDKLNVHKCGVELRANLLELIGDLNYLKQLIEDAGGEAA